MIDNFCSKMADQIDTMESLLTKVDEANEYSFRKTAKQILQKSYNKMETHQNVERAGALVGVGLVSAIEKLQGKYKKGSFLESANRLDPKNEFNGAKMRQLYHYLDSSDFDSVVKLVKITHKHGLKEAYRFVFS